VNLLGSFRISFEKKKKGRRVEVPNISRKGEKNERKVGKVGNHKEEAQAKDFKKSKKTPLKKRGDKTKKGRERSWFTLAYWILQRKNGKKQKGGCSVIVCTKGKKRG